MYKWGEADSQDYGTFLIKSMSYLLAQRLLYKCSFGIHNPREIRMIRLTGINKIHRSDEIETTALDQVSIAVDPGEFVAIMGPSGCGKSTLLNIIGLLDTPSSGSYMLHDKELARLNEAARADVRKNNIGVIFQSFNLIDELSVFQNIELALLYQDIPTAERRKRVAEVMDKVGIGHRQKHYPQQLSGGQQQRVAIARAIVGNPKILLADEPTGNLDSKNGDEVMALLKALNREGTTIIMVTHSEDYGRYGSRLVRMLDGRVLSTHAEAA
jgi:putative ABC transport system ATP-binding protein